ncbi:hypothetical protein HPB52_017752 [Rhipicephalus sanguineus]|uniref:BTB domain-containing protein n=1 Tax=Rhipicephalus sanguineus TaxID=34632 RepID=A0A9D4T436_RHISA|nr:hypothetical protein HPB52_017752 [Rhipicephalus sanguineus]
MLRKLSLHGAMSKARGSEDSPRTRVRVQESLRQGGRGKAAAASASLLSQRVVASRDIDDITNTEDGSEDFSQIASLLQTFSSQSNQGKKLQTTGQRKAQGSMVLPDIPEKISLEDWSVKACCIEDIVYPSSHNRSYITNSVITTFTDQASRADVSGSSLLDSSFTDSSSTLSVHGQPGEPRRSQRRENRAAGLRCRRNENPDIVVLLGATRFPCHRSLLSVHSRYFQEILAANPQTQKESCANKSFLYPMPLYRVIVTCSSKKAESVHDLIRRTT